MINAKMDTWDLAVAISRLISEDRYGHSDQLDAVDFEDLAADLKWRVPGDQESYTLDEIRAMVDEDGILDV